MSSQPVNVPQDLTIMDGSIHKEASFIRGPVAEFRPSSVGKHSSISYRETSASLEDPEVEYYPSPLEELEKGQISSYGSDEEEFEPPDGGFKAWACVAGCFLLQYCSFGYVNACGIFQLYYQAYMLPDQSSSSLAWITTLQIFFLFMLGPIIGKLVDAFGSRKVAIPFAVLTVLSVCMLSLCKTYWQVMLAQGLAFGIGSSGLWMPSIVMTTQWFSSKRGLAVGIVSSGSSLGGIIYPIMMPRILATEGFANSVRWTAVMQGVLLFVAILLISSPDIPKKPAPPTNTTSDGPQESKLKTALSHFNNLPWGLFALGCFLSLWGLWAPLNYLPLMALQTGMSLDMSNYTLSIINAGSVIGRVIPGWLSDRFGQFNMMFLVSMFSGALVLGFWLPLEMFPSNVGIIVFAAAFGFASGGFISLGPSCVVELAGSLDGIGFKMGGFCFAIALGALTGLPIEGAIKDLQSDRFQGLIIFSGGVMMVGGVLIGTTRVLRGGWSVMKKV